jgi:hypothetical protein
MVREWFTWISGDMYECKVCHHSKEIKWKKCARPGCWRGTYGKYCTPICQKKHESELKQKVDIRNAFGKVGDNK